MIDKDGVHRLTVLVKAHQADIGNSAPTTYFAGARDVYHEGALIFPAVQVMRDYQINQDIVRMCKARIRVPEQWHGDFLAMIGAAMSGERDLIALGEEIGWDVLTAFSSQWIDYGETRMNMAVRALTSGMATGRSRHGPMPGTPPEGVEVRATVRIDAAQGRISVDLTDNIDVLPCGLNVSESCARTAAMIGIFNAIDAEVPKNARSVRRIDVLLRPGSVIGGGAHPTSFSVSTTNIADRTVAAVQLAIGTICAEAAVAEVGAVNPPHKGVISGTDTVNGHPYINQLFLGSTGGPASARADAWLTYSHAGNGGICFVDRIKMVEMHHPIRVHSRALVADSEGAGEHIGAPCLRVELGPRGGELRISYVSDGVINAAQGVRGGGPGGTAAQALRRTDGSVEPLAAWGELIISPSETVISSGTGGGGYGDPRLRDPALVRAAVADRLLSPERALSISALKSRALPRVSEKSGQALRQFPDRLGCTPRLRQVKSKTLAITQGEIVEREMQTIRVV